MAKLQAHPEFIEALQNDPQTLKAIEQNPALLLQLIAALPDTPGTGAQNTSQTVQSALQGNKFANSNVPPSQLLNKHLNAANAVQNQNPGMNNSGAAASKQSCCTCSAKYDKSNCNTK